MEKIQLLNQQKKYSTFYCFCHPQSVAGDCFFIKKGRCYIYAMYKYNIWRGEQAGWRQSL